MRLCYLRRYLGLVRGLVAAVVARMAMSAERLALLVVVVAAAAVVVDAVAPVAPVVAAVAAVVLAAVAAAAAHRLREKRQLVSMLQPGRSARQAHGHRCKRSAVVARCTLRGRQIGRFVVQNCL